MRNDVYEKITNQIVSELEKGVRPWHQPWKAEPAAGRITRPLRGNGIPYQGINVLVLWSAAIEKGYAAPVWMTFNQALELKAHVRKREQGSLVVYADKIIRTETDQATGEESEHAIPFMKGYTVFNVEQIEGLPEHYYGKSGNPGGLRAAHRPCRRLLHGDRRECRSRRKPCMLRPIHRQHFTCPASTFSVTPRVITQHAPTKAAIMPISGLCRADVVPEDSCTVSARHVGIIGLTEQAVVVPGFGEQRNRITR